MVKIKILIISLCICTIKCYPQEAFDYKDSNKNIYIKLNVLSLFDITPSIQGAFQYSLNEKISIQHELGYISHWLSPYWDKRSELNGFRIKNQIKHYISPVASKHATYVGFDFMYKKTNYSIEEEFEMYDFAYFQRIRYFRQKDVFAFSLIFGYEPKFRNDKLLLDLFAGIGYRHLIISDDIIPQDASRMGWQLFIRDEGKYHLPNFCLGARIGLNVKHSDK